MNMEFSGNTFLNISLRTYYWDKEQNVLEVFKILFVIIYNLKKDTFHFYFSKNSMSVIFSKNSNGSDNR